MLGPHFAGDTVVYFWPDKMLFCTKTEFQKHSEQPELLGPVKEISGFIERLVARELTTTRKADAAE